MRLQKDYFWMGVESGLKVLVIFKRMRGRQWFGEVRSGIKRFCDGVASGACRGNLGCVLDERYYTSIHTMLRWQAPSELHPVLLLR